MRPGDLIFVRGNAIFSRLIRQATGGHWSHVEIAISETESVGAMEGQGIRRCVFAETFKSEEWQACTVNTVTMQQSNAVAKAALSMIGEKYDTRGIIGAWFKFVLKRIGIRLAKENPTQQNDKFFCSELVAYLYAAQGVNFTQETPALTSPSEIYEAKAVTEIPVTNRKGTA